jgi:8-oxo-dGTP pyrophosphatase MutT (NUDIX family)
MPAKSEAQRKAMYAASEGRSTLGIPASVGKEFVGADGENEHVPARLDIEADAVATDKSAGIAFIHNDRFLLIKRGPDGDAPDTWAFPGGHIELGETAQQAAIRECLEEVGFQTDQLLPEHEDIDDFCLFFAKADFIPTLNDESTGYVWATMDELPKPLHPNLDKFLDSIKFKSALYCRAMN